MRKKEQIVRHTTKELAAQIKAGKTSSNWKKAAAVSEAQLEASIAADSDETGMAIDWDNAVLYSGPHMRDD